MSKNWLIQIGKAVFLAGLLVSISACSRPGASERTSQSGGDAPAPVVRVERRDLSNDLEIASEFMPYQEVDVHAKVSGYIKKLYIDWGTHVKQGQLMAVLEVPELHDAVLRDQASVARDMQELRRASEELQRAQSAYFVANVTYTRFHGVQEKRPDLVAQEEVDVAHGKQLEAAAGVSAAQDALAAAQQQLVVDKSTEQRDQAMLDYSRITAPFTGVVTRLDGYTGALLPAGTTTSKAGLALCHLAQNDLLRLVIPVPEEIVPDVHIGDVVKVRVPSLNRVFQGKVSVISDDINLETRTMHTEVEVPNPQYVLVPGMYAYVQVPVKSAANALALPIQAVSTGQPGVGTVLALNGRSQIEKRQVRIGLETASEVQLLAGVQQGEEVVFGGQGRFHEGEIVKPRLINLKSLYGGGSN
ncbi:MAG: efflux RND transporter periplasmic adaptor subunit [Terriglobia bacterium]